MYIVFIMSRYRIDENKKKTALATFDNLAIARLNDAHILRVAVINYNL